MGRELLTPLAGCCVMKRLEVCMQLRLTTANLLKLCLSIPSLTVFACMKGSTVNFTRLGRDLLQYGHVVEIEEYRRDEDGSDS